jgi:hypothetical protein
MPIDSKQKPLKLLQSIESMKIALTFIKEMLIVLKDYNS